MCKRYRARKLSKNRRGAKRNTNTTYLAVDELYDQTVGKSFLLETEKTRSAYCFNHKAATTTWMSVFARLEGDEDFLEEMQRTQQYYKYELSSKTLFSHNSYGGFGELLLFFRFPRIIF